MFQRFRKQLIHRLLRILDMILQQTTRRRKITNQRLFRQTLAFQRLRTISNRFRLLYQLMLLALHIFRHRRVSTRVRNVRELREKFLN